VVLALDVSGSVTGYTDSYGEFVTSLVLRLNPDSRVGYLVFSDNAYIQFQVNRLMLKFHRFHLLRDLFYDLLSYCCQFVVPIPQYQDIGPCPLLMLWI